jgi:type I restriction enzyme R subunit
MVDYIQHQSTPRLGFREEAVEKTALAWLEVAGWQTLDGSYLAPDGPGAPRGDYREVILFSQLEDALHRLNPD